MGRWNIHLPLERLAPRKGQAGQICKNTTKYIKFPQ
jgi:hypothetical protein